MIRVFKLSLILLTLLTTTGCITPSYINIPPLAGDTALHNPNDWIVRAVIAESLKRVIRDHPPVDQYAVSFPEGVSDKSRELMIAMLPEGIVNTWNPEHPVPYYSVRQIWVRGLHAQVDIVVPLISGEPRLVSVFCVTDIEGWYGKTTRIWRLPLEQALELAKPIDPKKLSPVTTPSETTEQAPTKNTKSSNLGAADHFKEVQVKTPALPNEANEEPIENPTPETPTGKQPAENPQTQNNPFLPVTDPTPSNSTPATGPQFVPLPAMTAAPTPAAPVPPSTSIQNRQSQPGGASPAPAPSTPATPSTSQPPAGTPQPTPAQPTQPAPAPPVATPQPAPARPAPVQPAPQPTPSPVQPAPQPAPPTPQPAPARPAPNGPDWSRP